MSLFDINTDLIAANLTPVKKRIGAYLGWHKVLLKALQFSADSVFGTYRNGNAAADWDVLTAYNVGEHVKWTNKSIYECWVATTAGIEPSDADYWVLVQDKFVGVIPRSKYNCERLLFEYVLNEWFGTTFVNSPGASDIYIAVASPSIDFIVGATEATSSTAIYDDTTLYAIDYVPEANPLYDTEAFIIYLPSAVWTALGSTNDDRDNAVRNIADLYVFAGLTYVILTY